MYEHTLVRFGGSAFHTEDFFNGAGALELEMGLLLAMRTLGHSDFGSSYKITSIFNGEGHVQSRRGS